MYDASRRFKYIYKNTAISEVLHIDDHYIYCLCDRSKLALTKETIDQSGKQTSVTAKGVYAQVRNTGLYVYDIARLICDDHVEIYKLSRALCGVNNVLDYSEFSSRIAFLENFDRLQMQSPPHRNTINFVGMYKKS